MYAQVQGDSAQQAGTTYGAVTEGPGLPNGVMQQAGTFSPTGIVVAFCIGEPEYRGNDVASG